MDGLPPSFWQARTTELASESVAHSTLRHAAAEVFRGAVPPSALAEDNIECTVYAPSEQPRQLCLVPPSLDTALVLTQAGHLQLHVPGDTVQTHSKMCFSQLLEVSPDGRWCLLECCHRYNIPALALWDMHQAGPALACGACHLQC